MKLPNGFKRTRPPEEAPRDDDDEGDRPMKTLEIPSPPLSPRRYDNNGDMCGSDGSAGRRRSDGGAHGGSGGSPSLSSAALRRIPEHGVGGCGAASADGDGDGEPSRSSGGGGSEDDLFGGGLGGGGDEHNGSESSGHGASGRHNSYFQRDSSGGGSDHEPPPPSSSLAPPSPSLSPPASPGGGEDRHRGQQQHAPIAGALRRPSLLGHQHDAGGEGSSSGASPRGGAAVAVPRRASHQQGEAEMSDGFNVKAAFDKEHKGEFCFSSGRLVLLLNVWGGREKFCISGMPVSPIWRASRARLRSTL